MQLLKQAWRSAVLGWFALVLVHISSVWTGIGLGFGWLTCGAATVMGLPGVIGLILMNIVL